mmetsp:Transcript_2627/g.4479  ORF Transcript_2627/g.4479 Transcript_2627/m.4479 type:complete len:242 (+) Transcript_2627:45-770(+)
MEFGFDVAATLGARCDGPTVAVVDERLLRADVNGTVSLLLEEMGKRSAAAQGLRKPVTSGHALGDQRVYLLVEGKRALGVLKVGKKRLFVEAPFRSEFADVRNSFQEIEPLCTLDFYVHERCQRSGFGHQLFDDMLRHEQLAPEDMGYDRPSSKFLGFLKKHYGLCKHKPQNNNFVVFDAFWGPRPGQDQRLDGPGTCRQSAHDRAAVSRTFGRGLQGGQRQLFSETALDHQHRRTAAPIF